MRAKAGEGELDYTRSRTWLTMDRIQGQDAEGGRGRRGGTTQSRRSRGQRHYGDGKNIQRYVQKVKDRREV